MINLESSDIMRIRNVKNAQEIIANSKYIVNGAEKYRKQWADFFGNKNPIHLEIGCGKGDFLIDMAKNNPDINFIGLEKYTSVIVRALRKCEKEDLHNIIFINDDALNVNKLFAQEINLIYLNFSDPWPKKRTAKRRLTSHIFLKLYDDIFVGDKVIMQKTDNQILFESSIISLSAYGYIIEDISLDLWNTDKVYSETEYEHKFRIMGQKIYYLRAVKK